MEIWKDIKDFKGYQVSNLGRVRSLRRGEPRIIKNGNAKNYLIVHIGNKKALYVHKLVAETFLTNESNLPTVDHIDRNPQNNDVNNLRFASWKTQKENSNKAIGSTHGMSKLKDSDILKIKSLLETGERVTKIARSFNVGHGIISKIKKGKNWSHIK